MFKERDDRRGKGVQIQQWKTFLVCNVAKVLLKLIRTVGRVNKKMHESDSRPVTARKLLSLEHVPVTFCFSNEVSS